MKNKISKLAAIISAFVLAVPSVAFADGVEDEIMSGKYKNPYKLTKSGSSGNLYDDTRYPTNSPATSVQDYVNGAVSGVTEKFNDIVNVISDYYKNFLDWTAYQEQYFKDYVDGSNWYPENLAVWVHTQRYKDLVDYANGSTTGNTNGLTTGQNVIAFIAKRNLPLSFTNPSDNYEVDTMYYWRDFNHTESNDLTGVTIGNFYMRPNTIYVTRQFSNGDFKCFYADATQFELIVTQADADFVNSRFALGFQAGKTYYINNPDGTTEEFTFNENSTAADSSRLRFLDLNGSTVNSTIEDDFARQAYYFPKFSEYITDGVLTNIQLLCNNATKSDGSMMRPNNYSGSADGWEKWFMSSGAFIDNGTGTLGTVGQTFTINNYNYDPRKPPAVYNYDNRVTTNNVLTTENVDNYADYGITYNTLKGEFELDVDALAAGLAANLVPQLQGNFDLVYNSQPDIGGSDWTQLPNNFNADFETNILQIDDLIGDLPLPEGWQPPKYPPVNTKPFIDVNYPTIPTYTIQTGYAMQMGDTLQDGWDIFDTLGLIPVICPLIILLLLWRFTGK